jgi:hypothetical protein
MDDGRELLWYPPQPVAFNLVEAKRARDRGAKSRRNIMAKLKKRPSGGGIPGPLAPRRWTETERRHIAESFFFERFDGYSKR